MSDIKELLFAIQRHLPQDTKKPPLVLNVELVWTQKLDALRGHGALFVTTARELTTEGGNGWTGLDGKDLDLINTAISAAVDEIGATGMVDRFVVRAKGGLTTITDADIDGLFD